MINQAMATPVARALSASRATPGRRRLPVRLKAENALRSEAFRLLKCPLLSKYRVAWHWPRAVNLGTWERLALSSRSGATLAALYARADGASKGVVVCAHPVREDAKGYFLSSGRAEMLRRNGYDVLLFDFNGFGESSDGDFRYGEDVLAAAKYAHGRAQGRPVHALAACFGAAWTICAAAQEHPFSGIIVEAPLTTFQEYYIKYPMASAFFAALWRLFPKSAAKASPLDAVRRLTGMPQLLVIGGVDDTITPIDMSRRLYEACTLPQAVRRIWYVERAEHLRAFEAAPQAYEAEVVRFLGTAGTSPAEALTCSSDSRLAWARNRRKGLAEYPAGAASPGR